MRNEEGETVDLYIPRKCSWTNRLITSKDHASIQVRLSMWGLGAAWGHVSSHTMVYVMARWTDALSNGPGWIPGRDDGSRLFRRHLSPQDGSCSMASGCRLLCGRTIPRRRDHGSLRAHRSRHTAGGVAPHAMGRRRAAGRVVRLGSSGTCRLVRRSRRSCVAERRIRSQEALRRVPRRAAALWDFGAGRRLGLPSLDSAVLKIALRMQRRHR